MDHTEALNDAGNAWVGAHAFTGIEARPLDWADKDLLWERRYAIPMTAEQYGRAQAYMQACLAAKVKYDYRGCLGILLRRRKMYSTDRKDCSQFMTETLSSGYLNGRLLTAAGLLPLNVLPDYTWMITPEMLHLSPLLVGNCIRTYPERS